MFISTLSSSQTLREVYSSTAIIITAVFIHLRHLRGSGCDVISSVFITTLQFYFDHVYKHTRLLLKLRVLLVKFQHLL